jgi:GH43 family beta-xylosidase
MGLSYTNPVWPDYFADPFVLSWQGRYFAYGTGEPAEKTDANGASVFAVLRSNNLVHWEKSGAALVPVEAGKHANYWAPEVAAYGGRFFLFYSTAPAERDELHRIRVATAADPEGPFIDAGAVLPEDEGFCIDAHPFCDPKDGKWYLFFAKDFFTDRTGTGLAVTPLRADMLRAAAPSRPVLSANADWQIYERNRMLYGRKWDAWHTVEGPCVVAHDRKYYCFYSGGNWQTHDYGISYAVADHPLGPWQHAPDAGPVVLRQRPAEVLGPGHNSYALAADGRTEVLVYHAWDPKRIARRMCIDRLVWSKNGPRCLGPTTTAQTL